MWFSKHGRGVQYFGKEILGCGEMLLLKCVCLLFGNFFKRQTTKNLCWQESLFATKMKCLVDYKVILVALKKTQLNCSYFTKIIFRFLFFLFF